ncbi:DUF6519 domain-containing protein [Streptomyces sp. NPDC101393]|uniref:DUF6519 domain-containing protein n=1 Tax=Streptomyces sp. NPDC101393 TaxID=3366141 RepID=UPI003821DD2A
MGGDHSRLTFDPAKGFSGVHKQQGRVTLDADFNEFEEILDRRGRATAYDTLGQAVYPSSTTPDGFRIDTAADGQLTIGPGRMYVDGILVECFGPPAACDGPSATSPVAYDPHLGGIQGKDPLRYGQQPFGYHPGYPAPSHTTGAVSLVYLDVWQREVTVYEDDALREPALGGPDTATRVQTAWQVKSVPETADWDALTAPSTGRLCTRTKPVAPEPGPCVITPVEGYTGLENRLYRVEISRTGTLSGATAGRAQFRWSRDNASLGAPVLAVRTLAAPSANGAKSIVTVDSTGPDAWLRFEPGDQVELLDDQVEYACRERGTGGTMARVVEVRHTTGEIHVDVSLPNATADTTKHPRLRRWDVATPGDAAVREVQAGTALDLEDGITVTFSGTGSPADTGTLHAGDFWVFAARTADGTVEQLRKAPPRGILHHFAKLATVTTGKPAKTVDLRVPWPSPAAHGEGCCTAVVHPGEDIQKAIDLLESMGEGGGCVCLTAGEHRVTEELRIRRGNITLHGEAPWVTVRKTGGTALVLDIASDGGDLRNVTVQGLSFLAPGGDSADPMLRLSGVTGGRVAECALTLTGERPDPRAGNTGIVLDQVTDYAVQSCVLTGLPNGIAGTACERITVADNVLLGPSGASREERFGAVSHGALGIGFLGAGNVPDVAGMQIERNDVSHYRRGIQLGTAADDRRGVRGGGQDTDHTGVADGCRITANNVTRAGHDRLRSRGSVLYFAIAAHTARCEITDNTTVMAIPADCGIIADGRDARVARNRLLSGVALEEDGTLPSVLPYGVVAYVPRGAAMDCTVRSNLFKGPQQAVRIGGGPQRLWPAGQGPARGAPHRAQVLENRVIAPDQGSGWHMGSEAAEILALVVRAAAIIVDGVPHSRIADNDIVHAVLGVLSRGAVGGAVSGNRLSHVLVGAVSVAGQRSEVNGNHVEGAHGAAVVLVGGARNTAAHNEVRDCGAGIACVSGSSTRVLDNAVHRAGVGVGLAFETDAEVRGNLVEDASMGGIISGVALHGLTLAHNRTLRCGRGRSTIPTRRGFRPLPFNGQGDSRDCGTGISALGTLGTVTLESCQVIDTGEKAPEDEPLPKPVQEPMEVRMDEPREEPREEPRSAVRYGILVVDAGSARVSGCEVSIRPQPPQSSFVPAARSRALRVTTTFTKVIGGTPAAPQEVEEPPFADITDNLFEQSAGKLIEVAACRGERGAGEVMFAMNRCVNLSPRAGKDAAVQLAGAHVTVTGNRVAAATRQVSLEVFAPAGVSAVGNIVSSPPQISAGSQMPQPFETFNNIWP